MAKKKGKVLEYNVIFNPEDNGWFSVYVPDLPGCVSQGETFEKAQANIKEAIELYLDAENDELFEVTPEQARKQFMARVQVNA